MRVGLQVPNFTWSADQESLGDTFALIAQRAERAGVCSLWVMDHFFQIQAMGPAEHEMLEGYSALALIATVQIVMQIPPAAWLTRDFRESEDERGNLPVHQLGALLPQLSLERLIIGDGS
jgi:hypothetical protein